ncbi:HEAT repeat domain-containing protein [Streptomyces sp. BI20]|uniref:HEAT repeat domain-containing protein n=1 Tax=Streptomyces sp. BI20 TaxID=3403460 RepID=UPI003C737A1E
MTETAQDTNTGRAADADVVRALRGLEDARSSVRLRAALAVGTRPDARFVDRLVERCAVEPEFFVRDMLTWALVRHPADLTLPALLGELRSGRAQARSQALHTLSKIGDRAVWPAITRDLLTDADEEVARSAWRAAVLLVPEEERPALASVLATRLGLGDRATQLSLSQALVALGDVIVPVLRVAEGAGDPAVRAHALATGRLFREPDLGFESAIAEARRVVALTGAPVDGG